MQTAISTIIHKVLIGQFYKQHTVILAIVYMVMFGSVPGHLLWQYHSSLVANILPSGFMLSCVFLLWLIYSFKLYYFLAQQIKYPQHQFLQQLCLLPKAQFHFIIFKVVSVCLLPISSYALFMVVYGCNNSYWLSSILIVFFLILLHLGISIFLSIQIKNKEAGFYQLPTIPFYLPKKYALQFYVKYLFNEQAIHYSVIKLISIITITACFYSHGPTDEIRFSTFFYGMVLCLHFNLLRQFILWQFTKMHWGLPVSFFKNSIQILLFCVLLLLPEIVYLYKSAPINLSIYNCASVIIYSIASVCAFYAILIAMHNVQQESAPLLGLFLLCTYIAALANNLLLYSLVMLVLFFIVLRYNLQHFELEANSDSNSYE
jgi:hypothetical protein